MSAPTEIRNAVIQQANAAQARGFSINVHKATTARMGVGQVTPGFEVRQRITTDLRMPRPPKDLSMRPLLENFTKEYGLYLLRNDADPIHFDRLGVPWELCGTDYDEDNPHFLGPDGKPTDVEIVRPAEQWVTLVELACGHLPAWALDFPVSIARELRERDCLLVTLHALDTADEVLRTAALVAGGLGGTQALLDVLHA